MRILALLTLLVYIKVVAHETGHASLPHGLTTIVHSHVVSMHGDSCGRRGPAKELKACDPAELEWDGTAEHDPHHHYNHSHPSLIATPLKAGAAWTAKAAPVAVFEIGLSVVQLQLSKSLSAAVFPSSRAPTYLSNLSLRL